MALFSAACSLSLVGSVSPSASHSPSDPSLVGNIAKLTEKSAAVFRGKASSVQYKVIQTPLGAVPHTYVTYDVSEVIAGTVGKKITLIFVGGTDGKGGFLSVEGVPAFSVGDEDILFVNNNGSAENKGEGCALVGCEFGRYRIVDGRVYEAHGQPVVKIENGRIQTAGTGPDTVTKVVYPSPKFDQLLQRPEFAARIKELGMTTAQARQRYNAEAPKTVTVGTVQSETTQGGSTNGVQRSSDASSQDLPSTPSLGIATALAVSGIRGAIAQTRSATIAGPGLRSASINQSPPMLSATIAPPPADGSLIKLEPSIRK